MIIEVDESFYVILEKYLEGTISPDERQELRAKVASSPRCRREFVTTLQQESMLRSVCQNKMSHSARFDAQKILQQEGPFSLAGHKKVRDSVRLVVGRNSSRRKVAAISVRTRQAQISSASWAAVGSAAAAALVLFALIGTGSSPEHTARPERTAKSTEVETSPSSSIPAVPLFSRPKQQGSARVAETVAEATTPATPPLLETGTETVTEEFVAQAPDVDKVKPSPPTKEEQIAQARIFEPASISQPVKISVEGAQDVPPAVAFQDGIPAKKTPEPVAPAAQKYARINKLTGATASIIRANQKVDAAAGEEFIAGDLLQIAQEPTAKSSAETGCEVLLRDGSSILLRPGAALRFAVVADLFRPTLESGEIFAQVKPQPENRAAIFSTPVGAEVAVFAATFRMGTDASSRRVTLEVDSGQAYLRSQGVMRLVTAGRASNSQQGVAPAEPKAQSGSATGDGNTGGSGRASGQNSAGGTGNNNGGNNGGARGGNGNTGGNGGARGGGNGNAGGNAGGGGNGNAGGNAGGNGNGRGAGRGRP